MFAAHLVGHAECGNCLANEQRNRYGVSSAKEMKPFMPATIIIIMAITMEDIAAGIQFSCVDQHGCDLLPC